jgi:hypothetical protein
LNPPTSLYPFPSLEPPPSDEVEVGILSLSLIFVVDG